MALVIMVGMSMSGCADTNTWKEEVKLLDGRVIVIERETIRERGGDELASNPSGTKPKEYRIRFFSPDDPTMLVEWRSTKKSPATWPEIPLVLDIEGKEPVIFTSVFNSAGCHIYSKYFFRSGVWVEEVLPHEFEQQATNLLIFDEENMQNLIGLGAKKNMNAGSQTIGFRQVGPTHPYCR